MLRKPKSKLDARLRNLEKEAEGIRNHIKMLNKGLEQAGTRAMPKFEGRGSVLMPAGSIGSSARVDRAMEATSNRTDIAANYDPSAHLPGPLVSTNSTYAPQSGRFHDQRLTNYLQATGFSTGRPLRHERTVQRNKAIFMLLFALILGYIVYKLLVGWW